jgi:hypothetical protein
MDAKWQAADRNFIVLWFEQQGECDSSLALPFARSLSCITARTVMHHSILVPFPAAPLKARKAQ